MAKFVMIVPDGAADEPLDELDGKTILEAADIPNMDKISIEGKQGLVKTIPDGMQAGSDVAQMSLLGYDPLKCYTGRAPIEAVARGIKLFNHDWVFRCNLVTVADGKMADYSAGHISTKEGKKFIEDLDEQLGSDNFKFYPGVSYRHLLVVRGLDFDLETFPPHDYVNVSIEKILPRGKNARIITDLMAKAQQFFANHDINRIKQDLGENQVSSIWLWGQGKRASLEKFSRKFGLKGATITAVDLAKGLSKLIGFDLINVPGATGYVDTDFVGKGQAAIEGLEKYDIVFVHIEAPDEAGHIGSIKLKKKAVEDIDHHIVGPVYEALQKFDKWRILVVPDHPTPIKTCAHSPEPTPFAMAGTAVEGILKAPFSEANALESAFKIDKGHQLMEYFLKI